MRKHGGLELVLIGALLHSAPASGIAGHGHAGHPGGSGPGMMVGPHGRAGGNNGFFPYPYFSPIAGGGYFSFGSPAFYYGSMGYPPFGSPLAFGQGPLVSVPPQDFEDPGGNPPKERAKSRGTRTPDPGRSTQLATLGDRLFRVNNTKRAEERYIQAVRSDPRAAAPRVRLAQIAFVRGQYAEAAHRLREAETVEPGWLGTAPDIQSIYGEPGDFAKQIARLESHVHAHPEDRDAWLVLGAQWYLSGRTAKASDIFQRLNDPHRRPDIALTAFIEVTDPKEPGQPTPPATVSPPGGSSSSAMTPPAPMPPPEISSPFPRN